jgi:hypothetical protein
MLKFFLFDQLKRNLKQRFKHSKARFSVALMHVPGRTRLLLWSSNEARTLQGLRQAPIGPAGGDSQFRPEPRRPRGRPGASGLRRGAPQIERVAHGFSLSVLAFETAVHTGAASNNTRETSNRACDRARTVLTTDRPAYIATSWKPYACLNSTASPLYKGAPRPGSLPNVGIVPVSTRRETWD